MVISILKAYNIKKIVASPGTTNMAFVLSVQSDPFFEIYSSVDERSASYIACGLSEESGEPVVITCTGATASRNYFPGLTEAHYRKLPVLALTGSHGENLIGHLHPQVIDRTQAPKDTVNFSVNICETNDANDEWHNNVEINRAVSELFRNGGGPVHINLETMHRGNFFCEVLPPCRVIRRITVEDKMPKLESGQRIAVVIGSHHKFSTSEQSLIEEFCSRHNAVVLKDITSGYYGKYAVNPALVAAQFNYHSPLLDADLVLHIGEVSADVYTYSNLKAKNTWRISEDGEMRDRFKNLEYVFQMSAERFFSTLESDESIENHYYGEWVEECCKMLEKASEPGLSNIWVASKMHTMIPSGSYVYFGILNSWRSWNFYGLDNSVNTSCNVGGFGIDGPLSTALGGTLAHPDKLHFCVTGDLAFFYDMNALGNRHVDKNLRILLINNGCGTEFRNYDHPAAYWAEDANEYVAAGGHFSCRAKDLVKEYTTQLGFKYLRATTKEELESVAGEFTNPELSSPMILEVFTSSKDESEALDSFRNIIPLSAAEQLKRKAKAAVKKVVKPLLTK